jgi:alpha-L-rhamnosidase
MNHFFKSLMILSAYSLLLSCAQRAIVTEATSLTFESLSCESQDYPMAIEDPHPRLSWIVNSTGYNKSQTAYQVIVATNRALLTELSADMWNTDKVMSQQSINIRYQGAALQPKNIYWWKVRIWDETNKVSTWSEAQLFEMGLMEETQWDGAEWISLSEDTRVSEHRYREYQTNKMPAPTMVTSHPAGYFRKIISPDKKIDKARVYICGLGYYELYLNGDKVGDHVLDPAPSNYDKQAYYVSYDITDEMESGDNVIGIILGNGFYGQNISWKSDPESERDLSFGAPSVRLLVDLQYTDGSRESFATDRTWKESTGPIVFDNIYGGDTYDARYENDGWDELGYDDNEWGPVQVVSPAVDDISSQQMPPIRKLKELSPQKIFKSVRDTWIVDFGQNIAGWVKINVEEKRGQLVKIIATEALTQSGDDIYPGSTGGGANGMKQLQQYVCKGSGMETWEPKFSYHGFRYVEITGVSSAPDASSITAILVANDVEHKGSFECSDPLLNKMHDISIWTIVDNLHGIPEDCPHREKNGWLGDAHAFCEYALYNLEMKNFYEKYMEDIRSQMRDVKGNDGSSIKYKVPTMIAPGRRTSSIAKLDWGIATIYLPWYNYLYYGDPTIVTEYYAEMKGLTDYYLTFKDDRGIIINGMGDWCPPRWDRRKNPSAMECDPIVSANAYFYDILGIMEKMAAMNDDSAYAGKMKSEQRQLFEAFNNEFLESISGAEYKWYGSQTATVMALQFGMVPAEDDQSVIDGLVYDIQTIKGGHHSTGIHGNRYIYTVLTKYGRGDVALEILTTPDFPSQTYVMDYGFTTWPERQFEWAEVDELTNSLNHPMHSGFAAYFYESLVGVKPAFDQPAYRRFTIDPQYPDQLDLASAQIPTPYGDIDFSWQEKDQEFSMEIAVPFNTEAEVSLTSTDQESLRINGISWTRWKNEHNISDGDASSIVLGSGRYTLRYSRGQ